MFHVSDFRRGSYEHNGLSGRNETVLLVRSAGSGRDVFGNKNGAILEGGSRTNSEQSEGAGAVTGRAAGAVHRETMFCCGCCTKKNVSHGILHSKVLARRIFLHFY